MDVEMMMELLKRDYGIESKAALLEAIETMPRLDIGIFASPMEGGNHEEKNWTKISA